MQTELMSLRSNYFNIIAQQKKLILDQINDL
jgi:hypothetical protein